MACFYASKKLDLAIPLITGNVQFTQTKVYGIIVNDGNRLFTY